MVKFSESKSKVVIMEAAMPPYPRDRRTGQSVLEGANMKGYLKFSAFLSLIAILGVVLSVLLGKNEKKD